MKASYLLTTLTRGDAPESLHRGHIAVVNSDGVLLKSFGDPNHKTFFRSAMKPFQASVIISTGTAKKLNLTPIELAITAASHSAEPKHIDAVLKILKKAHINKSTLYCGPALPYHKPSAEKLILANKHAASIYHNCSGKHAGLLSAAKHIKTDFRKYFSRTSKIQTMIFETLSQYCDLDPRKVSFGVDGCGLPNYAIPIKSMATGFARMGEERGKTPVGIIGEIMSRYPWYIGGTKRFDTELMQFFNGALIAKSGAEGVVCISIPAEKIGISIKCEDGNNRAHPVIAAVLLTQLGILSRKKAEKLRAQFPHWYNIINSRNITVGEIIAEF